MPDDVSTPPPGAPAATLLPVNIEDEMRQSYLDYSMSVIIGRALPDARDGLKPVHRRVLFAMHELGNHHNRPYKKSARVVGDVIGKYHPHGDAAVYDTLVRMAQDFSMRYPLVDGQGNFGSVDGDPAAAMRYTECRLTRLAEEMLSDLDKETVDFGPNYNDEMFEPLVLPARFPNLLVNGSAGIAVGMATNIPPHNLGEVVAATIHLISDPKATVAELMQMLPGPDFPTAGFIYGRSGIREAYEKGRGLIRVRAKTHIETDKKGDRESIIIDEIPYQVNKSKLIERIAELVNDKKIEGISDVRDESDREGMRVVVELKRDAISAVVLNNLFVHTPMQETFGIHMLAIDGGQPRTLTLKEMLERFVTHRREVVTRRSRFELRKAEERAHIIEGLLVSQDLIDLVIALIRKSADSEEAKWALENILSPALNKNPKFKDFKQPDAKLLSGQLDTLIARIRKDEPKYAGLARTYAGGGFSPEQAKAILEMRLSKLTGLEREELVKELVDLVRNIARLRDILAHEEVLLDVIKTELRDVKERYGDARRTQIVDESTAVTAEDLIKEEDMVVTLSHAGYIKRSPVKEYRAQRRGGRGKTGAATKEDDFVNQVFVASTHAYVLVFTSRGRLYWVKVHEIPQAGRAARGKAIVNLLSFKPEEKLAAVLPVGNTFDQGKFVALVTRKGIIKKTELEEFSKPRPSGIIALSIEEGDDLVSALLTDGTKDILLSTKTGMAIRFKEDEVRAMGRSAYGVKGITLEEGDLVVSADVVAPGSTILSVTENGFGKRTDEAEYRIQGRGGKGIITIKTTDRNGSVVGALQVKDGDGIMLITNQGMLIRMRVKEISVIGRNTQGVRLITVEDEKEKVVSVAKLADEAEGGEAGPAEAAPTDVPDDGTGGSEPHGEA